jgi:hypothetical protein
MNKAMRDHDLFGHMLREPLQRGLLGRHGGIFRSDHVDAGVGPGGRVEQHRAEACIHEPVARAQRPPLARHRIIQANAEAGYAVVQLDFQAEARGLAASAKPFRQRGRGSGSRPARGSAPRLPSAARSPPRRARRRHKAGAACSRR